MEWGHCHTAAGGAGRGPTATPAPGPGQGVRENWSCSAGFSTQAPSPALTKARNRQALAAWYSLATSLDSWYMLGLVTLARSELEGTCAKTERSTRPRER